MADEEHQAAGFPECGEEAGGVCGGRVHPGEFLFSARKVVVLDVDEEEGFRHAQVVVREEG